MAIQNKKTSKTKQTSRAATRRKENSNNARTTGGGKNFHIEFKNDSQSLAWAAFQQHDVLFLIGPAGCGKAQPLDSVVYTPEGESQMGNIKVGSEVLTPNGTAKVIAEHPQGKVDIYKINFVDGDSVECCEQHLWKIDNPNNQWTEPRLVTTKWIMDNVTKQNRRNLEIELPVVCNFKEKEVTIDPYLMGFLLGDGCFRGSTLTLSTADEESVALLNDILEKGYSAKKLQNKYGYSITKGRTGGKFNKYTILLRDYGLWGKKSEHKFVPNDYLYNSKEVRLGILKGLMDTDGHVSKNSHVEYSTSSYQLANNVKFLVQSLGGLCKVVKRKTNCLPSYRCHIKFLDTSELFSLNRKKARCKKRKKLTRRIESVELIGKKEAKCITLSNKAGLYLTNNFVVTHNSFLASAFAVEQILNKQRSRIILTRPIVESGESLGFLPGEFEDKVHPYMLPLYDCVDKLVHKESPWRERIDDAMEVAPIAYMRGRSIIDSELIPTPEGFKPMGEIKVNDLVFGSDGEPTKVIGVYPQGKIPTYKIKFSDGTISVCCENHLWNTMTLNEKRHNKGYTTKTTKEIIELGVKNRHNQKIHRVPVLSAPVKFNDKPVDVDPYLLGVLLGDGHISDSISITSSDNEIIDECIKVLPKGNEIVYRGKYDFRIQSLNKRNKLLFLLKELNLFGKKSFNKFIPDIYKFNSEEVRLKVLQGLMDTDGWICKHKSGNSRIQYCSASYQLAQDVMFLVRSLGGIAYCRKREFDENDSHEYKGKTIKHVNDSYVVDILMKICPFKLSRKADQFENNQKFTKMISSIEENGEYECTCIQVEAKDSLFLTNDFIVTHNTFDNAVCIFDEAQNATALQLKLFLTRFGENSKVIITGDPTQSDIGSKVALVDVMKKLRGVDGVGIVEFKANSIVRHPLVGKIIEKLED